MLRRVFDLHPEERFDSTCSTCRRDARFTRFNAVERFWFFNIRGPTTGLRSHLVRCGSCGHQHHVRDLATLDSPMLSARYADALRVAIGELDLSPEEVVARSAALEVIREFEPHFDEADLDADRRRSGPVELADHLTDLRDNCHVSIQRHWLAAVIHVADLGNSETDIVERSARLLSLSSRDVAHARKLLAGGKRSEAP